MKIRFYTNLLLVLFIAACSNDSTDQQTSTSKDAASMAEVAKASEPVKASSESEEQSEAKQESKTVSSGKPQLRVCADPFMLPFSNKKEEGFENRISELLAKKLDMDLAYEFFPQRMGFIRNTLKKQNEDGTFKCDLVISVPENFELAATTDPYYTTSYVLAYVKGGKLDGLEVPEDISSFVEERNLDIKFGLADRGPAQMWVFHNDLMHMMIPYQGQPGDAKFHPGQKMMEELAAGKIDATIVWGPTGGYYAKQLADKAEIVILPLKDDPVNARTKYNYSMSMAVRYGQNEWKEKINNTIKENQAEIDKILMEYDVPLVK